MVTVIKCVALGASLLCGMECEPCPAYGGGDVFCRLQTHRFIQRHALMAHPLCAELLLHLGM